MSKKDTRETRVHAKGATAAVENKKGFTFSDIKPVHIIVCLAVICLIIYARVLSYPLINFDDTGYVTYNDMIRHLSGPHLYRMLTQPVMGNYHPVTVFSYALEYALKQDAPGIYHLDNLLLHIVASVLVYLFLLRLTQHKAVAVIACVLFAIHPMHVETVAWVADRKDLLYTIFFLLSGIFYTRYADAAEKGSSMKGYIICLLLFIAALMSKAVAVSLPLALLLIDFYRQRRLTGLLIAEKVPFFIMAGIAGYFAIKAQAGIHAIDITREHFHGIERVALGLYALLLYIRQFFLPFNQVVLYIYPEKINGHLPAIYYVYAGICAVLLIVTVVLIRKRRKLLFGLLFFLVTIAPLLQFIPVGNAIIADRYTYLPYMGLMLALAVMVVPLLQGETTRKWLPAALGIYGLLLAVSAYRQVSKWQDDISLWSRSVEIYPHDAFSYNQLGSSYVQAGLVAMAQGDAAGAMQLHSTGLQKLKQAEDILQQKKNPLPQERSLVMNNIGLAYANVNKTDSAIRYFSLAVEAFPGNMGAYSNRGKQYVAMKEYAKALDDYRAYIKLDTASDEANYMAGACSGMINDFSGALVYFNRSVALHPDNPQYYIARAKAYQHLGNKAAADADMAKAGDLQAKGE